MGHPNQHWQIFIRNQKNVYLEQLFPKFNSRRRITVPVQQMIDVILSSMPELYILESYFSSLTSTQISICLKFGMDLNS